MIFRQLFDVESCSYSYLLGNTASGETLLIDPVIDRVSEYLALLDSLHLSLSLAVDTHVHADHVTALGQLRALTGCTTMMGAQSGVSCVTASFRHRDRLEVGRWRLEAWYTPGHTVDSYSLVASDRVFTGDLLLIRGTGRTDLQNGDAREAYRSLFERVLLLPDDTLVYPAHDYSGRTVSTIGEERRMNPRLRVANADEYARMMDNLNLPDPKLMDVAVAANRRCGESFVHDK